MQPTIRTGFQRCINLSQRSAPCSSPSRMLQLEVVVVAAAIIRQSCLSRSHQDFQARDHYVSTCRLSPLPPQGRRGRSRIGLMERRGGGGRWPWSGRLPRPRRPRLRRAGPRDHRRRCGRGGGHRKSITINNHQ